ncbi:BatA domain-containing protein [Bremerella sp. JC770]|uniref:BatA domain-containing protein n=1 Tax=Bremerella sp. JC770 TaxID=3232137 RepID=UPI003458AFC5
MSVLSGIFLLGAAAIAGPILFHLIRRTPKARYEFSSLMFLQPSPPRLTRRSRLDQWLLLLLRSLVILLLAVAFMRPFFRTETNLSADDIPQRHVAIVIDQSASMRRGNVWQKAVDQANTLLDELESTDEVSLYAFDETLVPLVTVEETSQLERSQRRELVRTRLKEALPTWSASNLGAALVGVAQRLSADDDLRQTNATLQIVLISDIQAGSDLDQLQTSQWPESVRVDVRAIAPDDHSNARVRLVQSDETSTDATKAPRVRVRNSADSEVDQFNITWQRGDEVASRSVSFYVPPGESLVLDVPFEPGSPGPDRLALSGDGAGMDFDNTFFVIPPIQEQVTIAYFGTDAADDPEGMLFYLSRAFGETASRKVEVNAIDADTVPSWSDVAGTIPRLAIVSNTLTEDQQDLLDTYLQRGGHAIVVLQNDDMVRGLGTWLGDVSLVSEAENDSAATRSYAMLSQIDFQHPLFAPFASARYNDFTTIRFWQHRHVSIDESSDAQVIARFEDGSPAIWSLPRGEGQLYVMSAGWHRKDSQLALSTKFLPLLSRWLELAHRQKLAADSYFVNQSVPLPAIPGSKTIQTPSGTTLQLTEDATNFADTAEPGIYVLRQGTQELPFAVNLADAESDTAPLELDRLEQFGIPLEMAATQSEQLAELRQLQDRELENHQKVWKWLIVAVLLLLAVETFLAARRSHVPPQQLGDTP